MHRKRFMSMLAGVAVAGAVLTGGYAWAASGAPPARGTTTAPASGAAVRFTAYANDDLPAATVVLTGAIGDFGAAVSVLPDGTIDPEHTSEFNLALTHGSFRITIGPLHEQLVQAFANFKPNPRTCSGQVTVTGAAPVVAGSGTGSYKGIRGTFRLTISVNEVDGKSSCDNGPSVLLAQALLIAGSGTVSFR